MNEDTYHTLREAGYKPSAAIGELVDMLRGLTPDQCTRQLLDDLHAKAVEAKHGFTKLGNAILDEASK